MSVRQQQKKIEKFVYSQIIPLIFSREFSRSKQFYQWLRVPMNYVRIIELPLTLELLQLNKNESILDISSPKLLSLYLATNGFDRLTISDLLDYFIEDFQLFSEKFSISPKLEAFDATNIPHSNNSFDKVFSISVLEHIPDSGDIEVIREVARVLKPDGIFVITLPAYKNYLEEWLPKKSFYWPGKEREDGCVFYQRRYTEESIKKRFGNLGFELEDIVFIAEYPIKTPQIDENGKLLHNVFYLEDFWQLKLLKKINKIPLLPYYFYAQKSQKYHYLTRNSSDENIRQVAIKLRLKK
jgi:SAM-dependent methyltransferase